MRPSALTALLLVLALTPTIATPAQAAVSRRLCAPTAVVRDSPKGFVIARLRRPQRLQVQRHSADRRWALVVVAREGIVGWLPAASVCRA